jgi:hypothetical protein
MKTIYENFSEIAVDFTDGYSWTHRLSNHSDAECLGWQDGVLEFAKFLDTSGVKIIENPEICEALWARIRSLDVKRDKK